jgi:hemolysin activation/secretion protein
LNISRGQLRMLVFYDAGQVAKVNTLPGEEGSTAIASVGTGLRLGWGKDFSLITDYGYGVSVEGSRAVRNNRFHVVAVYSF